MDSFFALSLLDGCSGWFGALVLIVVGGVVARRDMGAGLGLVAAGAIKVLLNCCSVAPTLASRFGELDFVLDESVYTINLVFVQLQRLAFFGLLAFALTRLTSSKKASS